MDGDGAIGFDHRAFLSAKISRVIILEKPGPSLWQVLAASKKNQRRGDWAPSMALKC